MDTTEPLPRRWRLYGIGAFVLILVTGALVRAFSALSDYAALGVQIAKWEPFLWQFSSAIMIAALFPAVVFAARRFPLFGRHWLRSVPLHLAATIVFSLIHVTGMVLIRKAAYSAADSTYRFGPIISQWFYEYRKDVVTYALLVIVLTLIQFYRTRLQDAKRDAPQTAGNGTQPPPRHLVGRRLNREFVLRVDAISHLSAAGNYTTIHVDGIQYRARCSLAALLNRLCHDDFVRIHRSHVININHIREIQPWHHGDYRVVLANGDMLNVSRRYRAQLDQAIGQPDNHRDRNPA